MAQVRIIGVPMDLGAARRGVDMGPSALRMAGLHTALRTLGHKVIDGGNLQVSQVEEGDKASVAALHVDSVALACRAAKGAAAAVVRGGGIPLVLGGDHSVSAGSLSGLQAARRKAGKATAGLIWVDAHADANTPATSPTGQLHGMPLAALLGLEVPGLTKVVGRNGLYDPYRVALVGLRSVDAGERQALRELGVSVHTMREVDERGIHKTMAAALAVAGPEGGEFALSLDLDALDPREAPGVGTPVPGGFTYREAHLAMEMVADHGGLVGMDVVEVNPTLDERNRTASLAVGLVASALGRKII